MRYHLAIVKESSGQDVAVTAYVKKLIGERERAGVLQKDLADRWGVPASYISGVAKGNMGVGGKKLPGIAKAEGFASEDDFRTAAYTWWLAERARRPDDPVELAAATSSATLQDVAIVRMVRDLAGGLTPELIREELEWQRMRREVRARTLDLQRQVRTTATSRMESNVASEGVSMAPPELADDVEKQVTTGKPLDKKGLLPSSDRASRRKR